MALLLLAASLQGCATQLMHHNLGSRLERGWIVDRVVQTHRRLVVFYRAERVTYHAWFATTDEVSRWASIHLDTIHWRPITQFGTLGPGPQRTLFKEAEPPPRLEIPPDREIPVLKMPAGSRDDELHALQSTAANHPLSALCRPLEPFAALKMAPPTRRAAVWCSSWPSHTAAPCRAGRSSTRPAPWIVPGGQSQRASW